MSSDQTLYSELLVGSAICYCLVADILKIKPTDIEAFERESKKKKRGNLRSDKSGLELFAADKKLGPGYSSSNSEK